MRRGIETFGVSAEVAARIISQLLSCLAGIVAAHEIKSPESDLLDIEVHGYILRLAVEGATYSVKRSAVDLLAVLTDDTKLSCEYLTSLDSLNILHNLRERLNADVGAASITKTQASLVQLGIMNIISNIFLNISPVQSQCRILSILDDALSRVMLSSGIIQSIKLRSEEEHIDEYLEIVKGVGGTHSERCIKFIH